MIVVVDNSGLAIDDGDIIVVESLVGLDKVVGTIDYLVYHKSSIADTDFASAFSNASSKVTGGLWYICSPDEKDPVVEMAFLAKEGNVITDPYFLSSSDALKSLVLSGNLPALADLGGVNVLKDFTNRYLSGDFEEIQPGYLKVVEGAVSQIVKDYNNLSDKFLVTAQRATEVLKDSSEGFSLVKKERDKIAEALTSLQESIESNSMFSTSSAPSVFMFPTVDYKKERDIVRIKDYSNSPYLTSFLLGFMSYLKHIRNKNSKLIFIEPIGDVKRKLYSSYPWITQQDNTNASSYSAEVVFTNYPISSVITRLLDDTTKDFFVVVDRSLAKPNHILNCRNTRKIRYIVQSRGILDRLGVKDVRFFSSILGLDGSDFSIPYFEKYPTNIRARESMYLNECKQSYDSLFERG